MGEGGHVATEAEIGAARSRGPPANPAAGRGEDEEGSFPRGSEGAAPDHATISDFRPPAL